MARKIIFKSELKCPSCKGIGGSSYRENGTWYFKRCELCQGQGKIDWFTKKILE